MEIIMDYLPRTEFDSYEDFSKNFRLNVPEDFDFARDIVDRWAKEEPEKRALVYCNDDGFSRTFTFAEISELSKRAATYFLSLGIKKGERVLTLARRRWEYWICAVALHRIGAVVVPASIQLTEKDIAYRIEQAGAVAVIAVKDDFVINQVKNLKEKCPNLREIITIGDEPCKNMRWFDGEFAECETLETYSGLTNRDIMLIYFTSGTSGYPKMAIHDRTYPLSHIMTAKYMQCVQNNGLHLTQADSGWAKFGWGNIYGQWICGTAILGYDPIRFSAENLLEAMKTHRPTSVCIPPTMYRFLLHGGLQHEHVQSVQWFSTAGEALSGEVNKEFCDISGKMIHEGYGQSEGTPITCSFQWLDIRPSSMGKPSPLYNVQIIDKNGEKCPKGVNGEVVILVDGDGQVGLLTAYGTNGDIRSPIEHGVYHTGDVAYEDEDGYYWYVGRNDDMIKCSGYRIGPFEIESVLNTHPAVKESAVVGRPDEIRGQVVCSVIALREGYTPSAELTKELQTYVKKNTAPYKYPRVVEYIDALPKTTSGKIIRRDLKGAPSPQ